MKRQMRLGGSDDLAAIRCVGSESGTQINLGLEHIAEGAIGGD